MTTIHQWPDGTKCLKCGTTELDDGSSAFYSWQPICKKCNKGPFVVKMKLQSRAEVCRSLGCDGVYA